MSDMLRYILYGIADWVEQELGINPSIDESQRALDFNWAYGETQHRIIFSLSDSLLTIKCDYLNSDNIPSRQFAYWLRQSRLFTPQLYDNRVYLTASFPLFDLSLSDINGLMWRYIADLQVWLDELTPA